MAGYAKAIVVGNLTRDLELQHGQTSTYARGGIAVNIKRGNSDKTSFFDFTVFGKSAEIMAQHAGKGSLILLEGRLEQDTWEKDGQKRATVQIVVDNFTFMSSGKDRRTAPESESAAEVVAAAAPTYGLSSDDDDIPF